MPSLLNTVRDLERLRQIVGVLAVHGFGEVVTRTGLGSLLTPRGRVSDRVPMPVAIRIRKVFEDLGPSFVKLGQIISTRPDLIPAEIIAELKKLQDEVPPEPFDAIRQEVEAELGRDLDEVYAAFEPTPLASASIAQVHRAALRTADASEDVVVKVQRPDAKKTMERDIDLLYWLASAIERSIPEAKIYRPVRIVEEFDRAVTAELDFVLEADHCERFSRNFERKRFAKFPKVYREASAKRVLTLEYLAGNKVYDAIKAGVSGEEIARRSIDIIIQQIFEDGFFHADPHPGNVLILGEADDPIIAMFDVGMVGRLTPKMRDRVIDLMVAATREDYRGLADALYAIGRPTKKINREAFEAEVTALSQKYLGRQLGDIEFSALIRDLAYGARKYGLEIPADFLMLAKSLMTVEGVGKEIYPALDLFGEVKPYFLQLMKQRYSPDRLTQDVIRGVTRLSAAAADLPLQIQEILDDLRRGAFSVKTHPVNLDASADRLGRRAFSGMVVAGLVIGGSILVASEHDWPGWIMMAVAAAYATAHTSLSWWRSLRSERD